MFWQVLRRIQNIYRLCVFTGHLQFLVLYNLTTTILRPLGLRVCR